MSDEKPEKKRVFVGGHSLAEQVTMALHEKPESLPPEIVEQIRQAANDATWHHPECDGSERCDCGAGKQTAITYATITAIVTDAIRATRQECEELRKRGVNERADTKRALEGMGQAMDALVRLRAELEASQEEVARLLQEAREPLGQRVPGVPGGDTAHSLAENHLTGARPGG